MGSSYLGLDPGEVVNAKGALQSTAGDLDADRSTVLSALAVCQLSSGAPGLISNAADMLGGAGGDLAGRASQLENTLIFPDVGVSPLAYPHDINFGATNPLGTTGPSASNDGWWTPWPLTVNPSKTATDAQSHLTLPYHSETYNFTVTGGLDAIGWAGADGSVAVELTIKTDDAGKVFVALGVPGSISGSLGPNVTTNVIGIDLDGVISAGGSIKPEWQFDSPEQAQGLLTDLVVDIASGALLYGAVGALAELPPPNSVELTYNGSLGVEGTGLGPTGEVVDLALAASLGGSVVFFADGTKIVTTHNETSGGIVAGGGLTLLALLVGEQAIDANAVVLNSSAFYLDADGNLVSQEDSVTVDIGIGTGIYGAGQWGPGVKVVEAEAGYFSGIDDPGVWTITVQSDLADANFFEKTAQAFVGHILPGGPAAAVTLPLADNITVTHLDGSYFNAIAGVNGGGINVGGGAVAGWSSGIVDTKISFPPGDIGTLLFWNESTDGPNPYVTEIDLGDLSADGPILLPNAIDAAAQEAQDLYDQIFPDVDATIVGPPAPPGPIVQLAPTPGPIAPEPTGTPAAPFSTPSPTVTGPSEPATTPTPIVTQTPEPTSTPQAPLVTPTPTVESAPPTFIGPSAPSGGGTHGVFLTENGPQFVPIDTSDPYELAENVLVEVSGQPPSMSAIHLYANEIQLNSTLNDHGNVVLPDPHQFLDSSD